MQDINDILRERGLPFAEQAEKTILGAMLVDGESFYKATERLTTADFFLDSNQKIFSAMLGLHEDGVAIDLITVIAELDCRKHLSQVGDRPYLFDLSTDMPRNLNIEEYVRLVKDKSKLRQGINICSRILNEMGMQEDKFEDICSRWQMDMMQIVGESEMSRYESIGSILPRVVEQIVKERQNPSQEEALGFTYGIKELDRFTKGAFPCEYTIILAETGGAKTVWMTQIALENALRQGVKSYIFSQEMTKEQLAKRMLSAASKIVTAKEIRDPRFMALASMEDMKKTAGLLASLGIYIDDTRQLPLDHLLARAKAAMHRDGVKLIFVDYIQLVRSATGARNFSDTERIEATTLALRDLAANSKELGVHVVGLSQYSRPMDAGKRRPDNHRAKGSSSLEQSAMAMLHIIREQTEDGSLSNDVEIRIGKQRNGRVGSIHCVFDEQHICFRDLPSKK